MFKFWFKLSTFEGIHSMSTANVAGAPPKTGHVFNTYYARGTFSENVTLTMSVSVDKGFTVIHCSHLIIIK